MLTQEQFEQRIDRECDDIGISGCDQYGWSLEPGTVFPPPWPGTGQGWNRGFDYSFDLSCKGDRCSAGLIIKLHPGAGMIETTVAQSWLRIQPH